MRNGRLGARRAPAGSAAADVAGSANPEAGRAEAKAAASQARREVGWFVMVSSEFKQGQALA